MPTLQKLIMSSFYFRQYKKTEKYRTVNYELYGKPQQRIFSKEKKRYVSTKEFLKSNKIIVEYEPGAKNASRSEIYVEVNVKFYVKGYRRLGNYGNYKKGSIGSFFAYRKQSHDYMTPADIAFMVSKDEDKLLERFSKDNEGQEIWGNAELSIRGVDVTYKLNTP